MAQTTDIPRFRWVSLQLDGLKRLSSLNYVVVERALANLPKDLTDTYLRILAHIVTVLIHEAAMTLKWLAYSPRDIYIEELLEACIITPEYRPCVDPKNRLDPLGLRDILHGLVVIDPPLEDHRTSSADPPTRTHKVTLSHFSVKEFLFGDSVRANGFEMFRLSEVQDILCLASACLTYIFDFNTRPPAGGNFPFSRYAWFHWEHFITPDPEEQRHFTRRAALNLCARFRTDKSAYAPYLGDPSLRIDHEGFMDALETPYFYPDFEDFSKPVRDLCLEAEGDIRLFEILPSLRPGNVARGRLSKVNLDKRPEYSALSYTWGNIADYSLIIDGKCRKVSNNLEQILEPYQYRTEAVRGYLWIDSICIDQNDYEGKAAQVRQMERIYKQASRVLVSLGDPGHPLTTSPEFSAFGT